MCRRTKPAKRSWCSIRPWRGIHRPPGSRNRLSISGTKVEPGRSPVNPRSRDCCLARCASVLHHRRSRRTMASEADRDPRHHTQKMTRRLQETIQHLREDIEKVEEPQLKAMFETSAEVSGGLVKAFQDYERKNESAWQR